MTKYHGLKYCYDCKNKGFTISKGVFCSLTKDYPRFTNECDNYIFDPDEREKLIEKRKIYFKIGEIKENRNSTKYKFRLKKSLIRETKKYTDQEYRIWKDLPNEIQFSKKYKFPIISDLFVFALLILVFQLSGTLSSDPNIINYYIPAAIIIIIFRIIYFYYLTKRKKPILTISNSGIEHFKQGKFSWQEILLTTIKTKRGFGNVNYNYLMISLITSFEPITIPFGLLLNESNIENCIELYKEKYKATKA